MDDLINQQYQDPKASSTPGRRGFLRKARAAAYIAPALALLTEPDRALGAYRPKLPTPPRRPITPPGLNR